MRSKYDTWNYLTIANVYHNKNSLTFIKTLFWRLRSGVARDNVITGVPSIDPPRIYAEEETSDFNPIYSFVHSRLLLWPVPRSSSCHSAIDEGSEKFARRRKFDKGQNYFSELFQFKVNDQSFSLFVNFRQIILKRSFLRDHFSLLDEIGFIEIDCHVPVDGLSTMTFDGTF